MGSEWQTSRFGDLLVGGTRNGIYKSKEFHGSGTKIVNMGELFGHPRLRDVPMKRVELSCDEQGKSSLAEGDLLFARRSLVAEGAGKCSIVMEVNEPTTFESSIIRARPDPNRADSLFLYYMFSSPVGRHLLGTILRQVAVSGITGTDLANLEVPIPPLPEQKAIAAILGSLDDKIELNRRMNKTLEDLAAAVFKAWFIDFAPVKAKAAGATSFPSMPHDVFAALPNKLVDSPLGEVPEGWRISTIGEEVRVVGGSTPSTTNSALWDGGTHCWATPKDLSKLDSPILSETERRITDAGLAGISSGLLPVGSVLLSSRAPIGYLALAKTPTAINQGFIGMICDASLSAPFVLNWCHFNMDDIKGRANGTTFQEISKSSFRPMPVVMPPIELVEAFTRIASSLYDAVAIQLAENQSLAALRDTLLPKLLSGEVSVRP